MAKVKVKSIDIDSKGQIIKFDYFGKIRQTLLTNKGRNYLLSKFKKEILIDSEIEVYRQIQPKKNNPSQIVELFKIIKIY